MTVVSTALSCCGKPSSRTLDCRQFEELVQTVADVVILDVRTPEEFAAGHIPDAINIDYNGDDFLGHAENQLAKSSPLAIYCRSGRRSAEACKALAEKGYSVSDLEGGILEWQKEGLTVTDGQEDFYIAPNGKTVEIQPLIHASVRIRYDGKEIEIDPVGTLGGRTTDYGAFPKADIILVTHEHHDHLDPQAIRTLEKEGTTVIANPNSVDILGYGVAMRNGDTKSFPDGMEIKAVSAYNITPDRLQFHPKGRDNGYILSLGGLHVYIAGDTENIPEMKELGTIDIAFLPCNLPYTMTPQQLIEAAEAIAPKVLYPYHFGTTDLSSITPALAPKGIYVRICPFDP